LPPLFPRRWSLRLAPDIEPAMMSARSDHSAPQLSGFRYAKWPL
jgi:hypothetical protein